LQQIAHVGASPSINLKLISREIIFEVFQSVYEITVPERHRRTDRQTAYRGITAICVASRGKNRGELAEVNIVNRDLKDGDIAWKEPKNEQ